MKPSTFKYIYSVLNEEQRNLLQHNILKPKANQILEELFENYNLKHRLQAVRDSDEKLFILEPGCGDGHFLPDLADFFAEKGFLSQVDLTGLDINSEYLAEAKKRVASRTGKSVINYYNVDITEPLEKNFTLSMLKKTQFDCIFVTLVLQYLPNAQKLLQHLYSYLKPGGVIYLCDSYMRYGGEKGWLAPIPEWTPFEVATELIRDLNGGKVVAEEYAGWLQELGAEQIQVYPNMIETTDDNKESLEALRYYIAIVRGTTPLLLKVGKIDQETHDSILNGVYKITKGARAQLPFIHTIARKPE
jgi:SAM-dependent methyltransferase